MLVGDFFESVCSCGSYYGVQGTFVEFLKEGQLISATKLVDKIVSQTPKSVFFFGNGITTELHDLAFVIGDLIDLKRDVIVVLEEDDSLKSVELLPSWVIVQIRNKLPASRRINELVWIVEKESSFDLTAASLRNTFVNVVPATDEMVRKCVEITMNQPKWRFFAKFQIAEGR